jgi:crotonobetainyl-CoA:carnitine CoA-transferase CaiB-like acyl-CoA transferase
MVKPLDGIRIIEISQVYSLPFAGMMLAELGADVIKIENPTAPEIMRRAGNIRGGIPSSFLNLNRGKRFVGIDASKPEGAAVLDRLIETSDVLLSNLRPGKLAKLGVDQDQLRERNPGFVSVEVNGFGTTGPMSELPCYDFVIQAIVGMIDYQRDPLTDTRDLVRNFVIDKSVGHAVVEAVLAALLQKARTGVGQHVDINMLDVGMHFLWPDGMTKLTYVDPVEERPSGDGGDSYRVYRTIDGAIAMMPGLSEWAALCGAIDRVDLLQDIRFAERLTQIENNVEMMQVLGDELINMTTNDVIENCSKHDVPVARMNFREEVFAHPQIEWNNTIGIHSFEGPGATRVPRPPWNFHGSDVTPITTIGHLGANTEAVLEEIGVSRGEIDSLEAMGILVQHRLT